MKSAPEIMKAQEAADYMRISLRTLHNLERDDLLPVRRFGRHRRFYKTDIDKWSASRMTGVAG